MHHTDPNLLVFASFGLLFVLFKLLSDRKCYATLLEKNVTFEEHGERSVTKFVCVFWLHTGRIVVREVDHGFFTQVPVGMVGIAYHRGSRVTGLNFNARH